MKKYDLLLWRKVEHDVQNTNDINQLLNIKRNLIIATKLITNIIPESENYVREIHNHIINVKINKVLGIKNEYKWAN